MLLHVYLFTICVEYSIYFITVSIKLIGVSLSDLKYIFKVDCSNKYVDVDKCVEIGRKDC